MKKCLMFLAGALCALTLVGCCCGKCEKKDAEKPVCAQTECKKAAKCCCGNARCKNCAKKCCKSAECKDCAKCCKAAKAECKQACPAK